MKLSSATVSLLAAAPALTTTISYDTGYDQSARFFTVVACLDGANGLIIRFSYQTQGQIPNFPYLGGSSDVAGWNSASCRQCYSVTYGGRSIFVLAIDHAAQGSNIGQGAIEALTGGQAVQVGRVDATVMKADFSKCRLPHAKRGNKFYV